MSVSRASFAACEQPIRAMSVRSADVWHLPGSAGHAFVDAAGKCLGDIRKALAKNDMSPDLLMAAGHLRHDGLRNIIRNRKPDLPDAWLPGGRTGPDVRVRARATGNRPTVRRVSPPWKTPGLTARPKGGSTV